MLIYNLNLEDIIKIDIINIVANVTKKYGLCCGDKLIHLLENLFKKKQI